MIRAPRRVHGNNGFPKRLHVSCFYSWVVENWNPEHPENAFAVFEDGIDDKRRNEEHKRMIG